jgi:hypothetical protein
MVSISVPVAVWIYRGCIAKYSILIQDHRVHYVLTRIGVRAIESMRMVTSRRTVGTSDQWWRWKPFTLHVTGRRWYEPFFGVALGSLFDAIDCIQFSSVGERLCDVLIPLRARIWHQKMQ